jgi:hypothetical protein
MATVIYSKTSPYYGTKTFGNFLDVAADRQIPKDPADVQYTIDQPYNLRPDLLASDLYGDPALWWVFAVRNPNTIQDPVYDFTAGTTIFVPKKDAVVAALGL